MYRILPGLNKWDRVAFVKKTSITAELIMETVCNCLSIKMEELTSACRKRPLTEARYIAIYMIKIRFKEMTFKSIGQLFGNRDHSTIIYSIDTTNDLLATDFDFKYKFKTIEKLLGFEL